MTDTVKTYPIGWCHTCGTNDCGHLSDATQALLDAIFAMDTPKQEVKLKGLTGEPWND